MADDSTRVLGRRFGSPPGHGFIRAPRRARRLSKRLGRVAMQKPVATLRPLALIWPWRWRGLLVSFRCAGSHCRAGAPKTRVK
jgi:hypothetical protein